MADPKNKDPRNAPGRYYTDDNCIDCDYCREVAPAVFARDDDRGVSYVRRQPRTTREVEAVHEAMEACGVVAIGDDGIEV